MARIIALSLMAGGFLAISPPLRASALSGLAQVMFVLGQYSPWSYILLALSVGLFAVKSMASPKPQ